MTNIIDFNAIAKKGVEAFETGPRRTGKLLACPCGSITFTVHEGGPLQCANPQCNCFVQDFICRRVE